MMRQFCQGFAILLILITTPIYANDMYPATGMRIETQTNIHAFIGKPYWLLIIRDVDNNQTLPYQFEVMRRDNHWQAFTQARNYLITKSILVYTTYNERKHRYYTYKIPNFCRLETNGRILHDKSMFIQLSGDLTTNPATYRCHVNRYTNPNVVVARPYNLPY